MPQTKLVARMISPFVMTAFSVVMLIIVSLTQSKVAWCAMAASTIAVSTIVTVVTWLPSTMKQPVLQRGITTSAAGLNAAAAILALCHVVSGHQTRLHIIILTATALAMWTMISIIAILAVMTFTDRSPAEPRP